MTNARWFRLSRRPLVCLPLLFALALLECDKGAKRPPVDNSTTGPSLAGGGTSLPGDAGTGIDLLEDAGDDGGDGAASRCAPATFAGGFIPTRVLYVAPTGSDTADGLSPSTAWRTLRPGMQQLLPGDEVQIAPGTYACGATLTVQGTAEQPVILRRVGDSGPAVFDCGSDEVGLTIDRGKYIAVIGLEWQRSLRELIRISSGSSASDVADHIVFQNNRFSESGTGLFKAYQASNLDILNNQFRKTEFFGPTEAGQGVEFEGVHGARVVGNTFDEISSNTAMVVRGGTTATVIESNIVRGALSGISAGGTTEPARFSPADAAFEASLIVIASNVIAGDTAMALSVIGCEDCVVANNTVKTTAGKTLVRVANGNTGALAPARASVSRNLRLVNNLFFISTVAPTNLLDVTPESRETLVESNNLFFYTAGPVASIASTLSPQGGGLILDQDPKFIDEGAGDYRLDTSSPALGAGVPVPGITRDATGGCRGGWNIGAY